MKHIFYITLLYLLFSCKNTESTKPKPEPLIEKDTFVEQKSTPVIPVKKEDSIKQTEKPFLERLKEIKKEELPFKFHKYLIDSLKNEGEFFEDIYYLENKRYDSLKVNGIVYSKNTPNYLSIEKLGKKRDSIFHKYYGLLFHATPNYGRECCAINDEVVFKCLNKSLDKNIETFLTLTNFKDGYDKIRGIQINLVTYNIINNQEIDKKNILMAGWGFDNTEYYEGMIIYQDSIIVKGYNYTEPEMNIINKKFYITNEGLIKEFIGIEVIDHEYE